MFSNFFPYYKNRTPTVVIGILLFGLTSLSAWSSESYVKCLTEKVKTDVLSKSEPTWSPSVWDHNKLVHNGYGLDSIAYASFRDAALRVREIAGNGPVLGIGRSPSPVTTFLSLLGRNDVADVAISGFRNRPLSPGNKFGLPASVAGASAANAPLSPVETERLFRHFDQTIGAYIKKHEGSRISLVDLGKTGASLFAMKRYLDLYASARGYHIRFDPILLTTTQHTHDVSAIARYFGVDVHQIVLKNNHFIDESLRSSPWDSVAAYNSFDFHETAKGQTSAFDTFSGKLIHFGFGEPNPRHASFRTAVQANMLTDPALKPYQNSIPVLDLHVPGVHWDPRSRLYRNSDGEVIEISTGD